MKKLAFLLACIAAVSAIALGSAGSAYAGAVSDTPTITSAKFTLAQSDLGPQMFAAVGGLGFTPGGKVYTQFQDLTIDPNNNVPFAKGTVTAGSRRPAPGVGGDYGLIGFKRFLGNGSHRCGHLLRVMAWDYVKSPKLGWITRNFWAAC